MHAGADELTRIVSIGRVGWNRNEIGGACANQCAHYKENLCELKGMERSP